MRKKEFIALILILGGVMLPAIIPVWWLGVIWTVGVLVVLRIGIKMSILISAISFGLVWLVAGLYWMRTDDTDMIGRISTVLGGISSNTMLFVTFLVGIITGGLSGWLGGALAEIVNFRRSAQQHG